MREVPLELLEPLPDGLPRVSRYAEFLRVTGLEDNADSLVIWSQAAYTLMKKPDDASRRAWRC